VKCQGTGRQPQARGDMAGRHALRSSLNKEAENIETIFLRQRRQDIDSVLLFHISIGIEISSVVKSYFNIS
jgi:hypothetical protein